MRRASLFRSVCVGGAFALVAGATVVPVAGAQNVRVIRERQSAVSDSLVERIFVSDAAGVKRMIAEWRQREERLVRDLRSVAESDFPARRRLEDELGLHTRDGFAMMSAIEARCARERAPHPAGFLGVNISSQFEVSPDGRHYSGSTITSVEPASPAEKAGLRAEDQLIAIGGRDARDRLPAVDDLLVPGRRLIVVVERAGAPKDITLTVGRRPSGIAASCEEFQQALLPMRVAAPGRFFFRESGPDERRVVVETRPAVPAPPSPVEARPEAPEPPAPVEMRFFIYGPGAENQAAVAFFAGAQFRTLDADWASVLGVKAGVIVNEVAEGSAAAQSGLKGGDVITAVGKSTVTSPVELVRALSALESPEATLAVVRGKQKRTLTLRWGSR